jgi:hypothetical protein
MEPAIGLTRSTIGATLPIANPLRDTWQQDPSLAESIYSEKSGVLTRIHGLPGE